MNRNLKPTGRWAPQKGAATLIVVMILFFIMSLVAAYTNRSLIFEQRTSANQYRSTQALEVAEAGLEWAISQLNFGRIDAACVKSTSVANNSFRQRYLNTNATTGHITPDPNPAGGDLTSLCVWNGAGWTCNCPSTGLPTVAAPTPTTTATLFPAFRVRFRAISTVGTAVDPTPPGVVWVDVVGCTRLGTGAGDACLSFTGQGALNEGRAVVSSMVALTGNVAGPPQAAVLARGAINLGSAPMTAYNTAATGSGITLHSGGAITGSAMVSRSAPGTPGASSMIENDAALTLTAATPFTTSDRMFAAVFRTRWQAFREQPAAVELDCTAPCSAAAVRTAVSLNPGRPLWLTGSLNIDSAGDIGTATDPVVLVVNGQLQHALAGSGTTIHGLVYLRVADASTNWDVSGSGQINGAVATDGGITSSVSTGPTVVYDPDVLRLARFNVGSFVRVPGSWRDFR